MPMTPKWKLIFTILIQHRPPEEFSRIEKAIGEKYVSDVQDPELKEQARRRFRSSRPILHRFNDLVGFAEVYWDRGTRIMVDYYFRGDGRTRYGHRILSRGRSNMSREWFYPYPFMIQVSAIHRGDDAKARRQAILRALDHVEETAREVLCFANTSHERAIVQALDVDAFLVQ